MCIIFERDLFLLLIIQIWIATWAHLSEDAMETEEATRFPGGGCMWVLGAELGSSRKGMCTLNCSTKCSFHL